MMGTSSFVFSIKMAQKMKVLTMPIASTFNSQRKYFHCPSQVLAFFEGILCLICSAQVALWDINVIVP